MSALAAWTQADAAFASEVIAKATVVLCGAAALGAMLRRATPATRHGLWLSGFVAALILPTAVALLPDWRVPLLPAEEAVEVVNVSLPPDAALADAHPLSARGELSAASDVGPSRVEHLQRDGAISAPPSWDGSPSVLPRTLGWLWMIGLGAWTAWLLGGVVALRRVARTSETLEADETWRPLLAEEVAAVGLRRPVRLLRSAAAGAPVTWGVRTPIILLPLESAQWSTERRRVVLRHELAHVARWDSLTQLAAGLACGVYWFHPMVWWAARQLRRERERACDDRVLASGIEGTRYAEHLLELARSARSLRIPTAVTAALSRPSELESRVLALLDSRRRPLVRSGLGRATLATLGALAVVLAVAAFQPARRAGLEASPPRSQGAVGHPDIPGKVVAAPAADGAAVTGDASVSQEVFQVRDSSGVRIVEHGRVAGRVAPFRISRSPVYRVGQAPGERVFQAIENTAVLFEGGRAAVVDAEARQIVFLSPSGQVEDVLGGPGDGPGQYEGIFSITRIAGDTIVVQDVRYPEGKLSLLHDRAFVREIPVGREVAANKVLGVGRDGRLMMGMPVAFPGVRATWFPATLATFDLSALRRDSVGSYDMAAPFDPARFNPNGAAAVSSGTFVIGRGDRPELRWLEPDGRVRQIVRWQPPAPVVSDSMWLRYEADYRAGIGTRQSEDYVLRHLEGVRATSAQWPIFRRIVTDADGNVWIGSHGWPLDYYRPEAYDVLSPQGVWLGAVTMPAGFQVLAIGGDRILGTEDVSGVHTVVMYRIER